MTGLRTDPPRISRLMLATDLSCRCDRALYRARELAAKWRAKLTIVTAVDDLFNAPSWRSKRAAMTQRVRAELSPELDSAGVEWDAFVDAGSPADVVIKAAEQFASQLIVTGIAHNELLGRTRLGGTVEALLGRAVAPLLMVKRRGVAAYRQVVVPTDFTEAGEIALIGAMSMFPEARFVLLHGYRIPFSGLLGEAALADEIRDEATQLQHTFARRLQARGHDLPEILIEHGSPESLVADYEGSMRPDLIVVGAHSPDPWLRSEVTGAAGRIVAAAACDVLIVPEKAGPLVALPSDPDRSGTRDR